MGLSPQSIQEFQEIYKTELGEELSYEEAEKQAKDFLNLYLITTQQKNDWNKRKTASRRTIL